LSQTLERIDVVIIGVGMVGSIVAKELAAAAQGSGLERAAPLHRAPDFQSPCGSRRAAVESERR